MTRDAVTSDQLPPSGLPFSVAVRGGGLLFLSGQVAQDPATGELVDGDVAQQADQILRNIAAPHYQLGRLDLNRRPLDPQDGGSRVIRAHHVFFVQRSRSLTCGLFSAWHAVWSPSGPQSAGVSS